MRTRTSAFGFLLFAVFSTPAYAQSTAADAQPTPTPPAETAADASSYPSCMGRTISPEESSAAHGAYLAGRRAYDNSNWDVAVAQYREAYRRDCTKHDLLINISRAYEAKGDLQEALNALQTYFDRVLPSSADAALRARMENIEKRIAAEAEAKTKAKEPVVQPPPPAPARSHTVLPWVVVGVGGAAVVTGVVLLVTKPKTPSNCDSSSSTCSGEGPDIQADQNQAAKSKNLGVAGVAAVGAGIAVVAGGLIWHFLEPTGPAESRSAKKPTITPSVGPGFAGVSVGGPF